MPVCAAASNEASTNDHHKDAESPLRFTDALSIFSVGPAAAVAFTAAAIASWAPTNHEIGGRFDGLRVGRRELSAIL
jgi:hypothetical protein